jgi:hypothetical protein
MCVYACAGQESGPEVREQGACSPAHRADKSGVGIAGSMQQQQQSGDQHECVLRPALCRCVSCICRFNADAAANPHDSRAVHLDDNLRRANLQVCCGWRDWLRGRLAGWLAG